MSPFAGPLSIKSVVCGQATWRVGHGRFELAPASALVLAEGEEYTLVIDSLQPVETFCIFFARGFVEDVYRAMTMSSAALLDEPFASERMSFCSRLEFDPRLLSLLGWGYGRMRAGEPLDALIDETALALARAQHDVDRLAERLPVARPATRVEVRRRVETGLSYMHANLGASITLDDVARHACMSPFHFHRHFTFIVGETPHRYLSRLRLERAKSLLRSTATAIGEIASACGFESTTSFTTLFTRRLGRSPREFRKNEEKARLQSR